MRNTIWLVPLIPLAACQESNIRGPDQNEEIYPSPVDLDNELVVDRIIQVTTPQADILWTIDNSGSMSNEQDELVENFPYFMQFFAGSGLDYHIAITSTDSERDTGPGSGGTFVRNGGLNYIDDSVPDPVGMFSTMAKVGTSGGNEAGIGAIYLALEVKLEGPNQGFWRDDAALHTIVISDEADYTSDSVVELNEFINWYDGLKPVIADRTFSSITERWGSRYRQVTREIGGVDWDLVDENWPGLLEQLGLQASGFDAEYFLTEAPIEDTIMLQVETPEGAVVQKEPLIDWIYNPTRNSITFLTEIPDERSTVVITYERLASDQDNAGLDTDQQ